MTRTFHDLYSNNLIRGRFKDKKDQYVLDLTRKEVANYVYESIKKVLNSANITYVKWDMNRNIN